MLQRLIDKAQFLTVSNYLCITFKGRGFEDITNIKKYGKVFKLLEGRAEIVIISDTEILKHVLVKDFTEFTNRRVNMKV